MPDVSSLPLACIGTLENFNHRLNFWRRVPGHERHRFWETDNPDRPYSHKASDVVQFTKANCLAATAAHNSKPLVEFKRKLYTDWDMNKTSPFEGMQLAQLLSEYLVWIDRLFFFGLITRPTTREGKLVAGRPIIKLRFENELRDSDGNDLNGVFIDSSGELCVNMLEPSGKLTAFNKAVCVIVHELTHVYLHILTRDSSSASYYREIWDNGHGVQFYELLLFMLTQLSKFMPTIPYFEELATDTRNDLHAALARPAVSEAVARSLIYAKPAAVA
ncbi:hypothetical protein F5B21DRAFT_519861 [Xylaria acuta]|nr:hypothetical protein F5B21DRAFT_519861 [Xylaria acuta]